MIDMHRPKSSSLQFQMDQMSDAQILDTIKSRHLQSPSELIAWSECLMSQAKEIEDRIEQLKLEKEAEEKARLAAEPVAADPAAGVSPVSSTSE